MYTYDIAVCHRSVGTVPIVTWLVICVQIWIEYVPIKELRKLDMEFPLPDLSAYYHSDVCVY